MRSFSLQHKMKTQWENPGSQRSTGSAGQGRVAPAQRKLQALMDGSPRVQHLARLQATMNGNPHIVQRVASGFVTALRADTTVQLAKLNIRKTDGTISGVSSFINRPPSNLGFQGQHLTAYVSFEQTVLSRVRDRKPSAAAAELREVIREILALPAMESPNQWNKHIHASLGAIDHALKAATTADEKTAANIVGVQIDGILRERNRVPGTAISEVGTTGHGEAKTAGALEMMETALRSGKAQAYGQPEMAQAVECLWALFDYDPPNPTDDQKLTKIKIRVLTHMMSVRTAFPEVFGWLTGNNKYWLIPYLRQHRAKFTALQRVSDQNLGAVELYVHANL